MDLKFPECKVLLKKLTQDEVYQFSGAWNSVAMNYNRFIQEHQDTKPRRVLENTRIKDKNDNSQLSCKTQKCGVSPHLYERYKAQRQKFLARRTVVSNSNCNQAGLGTSTSDTTVQNSKISLEEPEVLVQNSKSIKSDVKWLKPSNRPSSKHVSTNSEKPSMDFKKTDKSSKKTVPDSKSVPFSEKDYSTCRELKHSRKAITSPKKETLNSLLRTETEEDSPKSMMPAFKRRLNAKITKKSVASNSKAGSSVKILEQSSKTSASNIRTVLLKSKVAKSLTETTSLRSKKLASDQQTPIISKDTPTLNNETDGQSIDEQIVSKSKAPSDKNKASLIAIGAEGEKNIQSSTAISSKDKIKTSSLTAMKSKHKNETSSLTAIKSKDQNKTPILAAVKSTDRNKTSSSNAVKSKDQNKASSLNTVKSKDQNKTTSLKAMKSKEENKGNSTVMKSKEGHKTPSSKAMKSTREQKTSSSKAVKSKHENKISNLTETNSKNENKTSSLKAVKDVSRKSNTTEVKSKVENRTSNSTVVKSKEENKTSSSIATKSKNETKTSKSSTKKSKKENEASSSMTVGSKHKSTDFADSNAKNCTSNTENESEAAASRAVSALCMLKIPCSIARSLVSCTSTSKSQTHITNFKAVQTSSKTSVSDSELQDSENHLATTVSGRFTSSPQSIISSPTNRDESDDSQAPVNSETEIKMKIKRLNSSEGDCKCSSSWEVSTIHSKKCKCYELNDSKSTHLSGDDSLPQKKPIKRTLSKGFKEAANKNTEVDKSNKIITATPICIELSSDSSCSNDKVSESESLVNSYSLDNLEKGVQSLIRVIKHTRNERSEKETFCPLKYKHHVRKKSDNQKTFIVKLSDSCDPTNSSKSTNSESNANSHSSDNCTKTENSLKRVKKHTEKESGEKKKSSLLKGRHHIGEGRGNPKAPTVALSDCEILSSRKSTKSESNAISYSLGDCAKTENSPKRVKKHAENERSEKTISSLLKDRHHVGEGRENPKAPIIALSDCEILSSRKSTKSESNAISYSLGDCAKTENSPKRVKKHAENERSEKKISSLSKNRHHVREGSKNPQSPTLNLSNNCDGDNFSSTNSMKSNSNVSSPKNSAMPENSSNKAKKQEHGNKRKSSPSKEPHVHNESEIPELLSKDLSDSCDNKSSKPLKTSPPGKRKSRELNLESTPQKKFKQSSVSDASKKKSTEKKREMVAERSSPRKASPTEKKREMVAERSSPKKASRPNVKRKFSHVNENLQGETYDKNPDILCPLPEKPSIHIENSPSNIEHVGSGSKSRDETFDQFSDVDAARSPLDPDEPNRTVKESINLTTVSSLDSVSNKVSNNTSDKHLNQTSPEVTSKTCASTPHNSSDILSSIMKDMDHLPNYKAKLISKVVPCSCCPQTKVLPVSPQMQYDNEAAWKKGQHADVNHLEHNVVHCTSTQVSSWQKICKSCNFKFVSKLKNQLMCTKCLNRHKTNYSNSFRYLKKIQSSAKYRSAFGKSTSGNLIQERCHNSKNLNTSQDGKHSGSLKCGTGLSTVPSQLELTKASSLEKTSKKNGSHSLKASSSSCTVQTQPKLTKAKLLKKTLLKQGDKKDGGGHGETEMEGSSISRLSLEKSGVVSDEEDDSYPSMPIITAVESLPANQNAVSPYETESSKSNILSSELNINILGPPVLDIAIFASPTTPVLSKPIIPISDPRLTDSKILIPSITKDTYGKIFYQRTSTKSNSRFSDPVITSVVSLSADEFATNKDTTEEIKSLIFPSKNFIKSKDSDIKIIGLSSIDSSKKQFSASMISTNENRHCSTSDCHDDKSVLTSEDENNNMEIGPGKDNPHIGEISDERTISYTGKNRFSCDAERTLNEITNCVQALSTDMNENQDITPAQKSHDSPMNYRNKKVEEVSECSSDSNSVKLLIDIDNSEVSEISNETTDPRTSENCISYNKKTTSDSTDSIPVLSIDGNKRSFCFPTNSSEKDDGCSATFHLSTMNKPLEDSDNSKEISEHASGNENVDDQQLLEIADKITGLHSGVNCCSPGAKATSSLVSDIYEHKDNSNKTEKPVEILPLEINSVGNSVPDIAKTCPSYDDKETPYDVVTDISENIGSNQGADINMDLETSQLNKISEEKSISHINENCNSCEIEKKSEGKITDILVNRENMEMETAVDISPLEKHSVTKFVSLQNIISYTIGDYFSFKMPEFADEKVKDLSQSKENVEGKKDDGTPLLSDICDKATVSHTMENSISCSVEGDSNEILKDVSGSEKMVEGILDEVQQLGDTCDKTILSPAGENCSCDAAQISCNNSEAISGRKESIEGKTDEETFPLNEVCDKSLIIPHSVENCNSYDAEHISNEAPKVKFENKERTETEKDVEICHAISDESSNISDEIIILGEVKDNTLYARQTSNCNINDNSKSKKNTEVEMDLETSHLNEISDKRTASCISENNISCISEQSLNKELQVKHCSKRNTSTVLENYDMDFDSELNKEPVQKETKLSVFVHPIESQLIETESSSISDELATNSELDSNISTSDCLKSIKEGTVIGSDQNSDEMPNLLINSSSEDITECNMITEFNESEIFTGGLFRCTKNVTNQNKIKRISSFSESNVATDINQNEEKPNDLYCSEHVNSNADGTCETNRQELFDLLTELRVGTLSNDEDRPQNVSASSFIDYITIMAQVDLMPVDLNGIVSMASKIMGPKHISIQHLKNIFYLSKNIPFDKISNFAVEVTQKSIATLEEKIERNRQINQSLLESLDSNNFRIVETDSKSCPEISESFFNNHQNSANLDLNEENNMIMCNTQENQQNEIPSSAMNSVHIPHFDSATNCVAAAESHTEAINENTPPIYSTMSLTNDANSQETQPFSTSEKNTVDKSIENMMLTSENNITFSSSNNVVHNSNIVQAGGGTLIETPASIVSTNESIGNSCTRESINQISSTNKSTPTSANHYYNTPVNEFLRNLASENTPRSMPQHDPLKDLYSFSNAGNYPVNYSNILPASTLTKTPGNNANLGLHNHGLVGKRASPHSANPQAMGQNHISFNPLHYMPSTNHHQHIQAKEQINRVPVSHYMTSTTQHLQPNDAINHVPVSHYPQYFTTERSATINPITQSSPTTVSSSNSDYMGYAPNRTQHSILPLFQNQREAETYHLNTTSPPVSRSALVPNMNMSVHPTADFNRIQFHQPNAAYSQFPVNNALPQQNPNSSLEPTRTVEGIQRHARVVDAMRHQVLQKRGYYNPPLPYLRRMPNRMAPNRYCLPGSVQAPNVTPLQSLFSTRRLQSEQVPQVPRNPLQHDASSGTQNQFYTHWMENHQHCRLTPH